MVKTMIKSMEQDTDKALLIVKITNKKRLSAGVTEDFFLVDCKDFGKAINALDEVELYNLSELKSVLDGVGVTYQHVLNGERFYFGVLTDEEIEEYSE